jgi:hypothetical protein
MSIFALAAAGMSAFGQIRAGQAAALASSQQADQMEIDREANTLQALQVQNSLVDQYNVARATNDAQFSFMLGGGESSSVDAFKRAQQETIGADLKAAQLQSNLEGSKMTVGALLERERGKNAKTVSRINAMSVMASGIDGYISTAAGSASGSGG